MICSLRILCSMKLKVDGQFSLRLVRPMVHSDISEVVGIERQVTYHPWTQISFSESLKSGYRCWVVEFNSRVIAYLVQSIYNDESHILNLAVTTSWQGQGLGRVLVKKACTDAAKNRVTKILLEVRLNNLIAQQLYESEGFLVSGRRHNYYRSREGAEDALVMVRNLKAATILTA